MKDVKIPPNSPKNLLLGKHADFIAAYGKKKDDYVSEILQVLCLLLEFEMANPLANYRPVKWRIS